MDWASHMRRILVHLGEDVTLARGTGQPVTVTGVYLSPYEAANIGLGGVTSSNPHFAFMTADYTAAVDDVLTRQAVAYKVKVRQPDDPSGITVLELKRTS